MLIDLANDPRLNGLRAVAVKWFRKADAGWERLRSETLASISEWRFATGAYYSLDPLGPEGAMPPSARGELVQAPRVPGFSFGFDAERDLRFTVRHLDRKGATTCYVWREGDHIIAAEFAETRRGDHHVLGVGVTLIVTPGREFLEVGYGGANAETRAQITKEDAGTVVIRRAARDWERFRTVITYTGVLDADGVPLRVTVNGQPHYERPRGVLAGFLKSARSALHAAIRAELSSHYEKQAVASLYLVHGDGEELFPPQLFVLTTAVAETRRPKQAWSKWDPSQLEDAGVPDIHFFEGEKKPQWCTELQRWLHDPEAADDIRQVIFDVARDLQDEKWPSSVQRAPGAVMVYSTEDGTCSEAGRRKPRNK